MNIILILIQKGSDQIGTIFDVKPRKQNNFFRI